MTVAEHEPVHLRRARSKRRRKIPNGSSASDAPAEWFTLCGKWIVPRLVVRKGTPQHKTQTGNVCLMCAVKA